MYLISCVETEVGKNEEIFDNSAFVVHSLMQIAPLYCSKRIFFVSTIDSSGVQAHTFHNDHISTLQPTSGFQNSADWIGLILQFDQFPSNSLRNQQNSTPKFGLD
jgi:hypothetical protein